MHPFFLVGLFLHLTILAVVAFFVLFAASKADGFIKLLGNVLGGLLLIVAVLGAVGGASAPFLGGRPFGIVLPEGRWMHRHGDRQDLRATSPSGQKAPATSP
jgi:hypothetical protein